MREEGFMESNTGTVSKKMIWLGRILSTIAVLFMLFDGVTKVMKNEYVIKATAQLGYPESLIPQIGLILLVCVTLYVIPRTSILGAILLTGFLGGAVATNVRIENPLFSHTLFPVYVAILVWGGLFLRDVRVRSLFALHKGQLVR